MWWHLPAHRPSFVRDVVAPVRLRIQHHVPGTTDPRSRAGQGGTPGRPLRRDRRRGPGELGVLGAAHRGPSRGLLARRGIPRRGGGGAVPGPGPGAEIVAGRDVSCPQTGTRGGRARDPRPPVPGRGPPVGEGERGGHGRAAGFREPERGGSDGLRVAGGGERPDRLGCDGGRVQGDREAAAVWVGGAVEGNGGGGRPEPEVSELHPGALGPILVQGGSVWISGGRVTGESHRPNIYIKFRPHPNEVRPVAELAHGPRPLRFRPAPSA